MSLTAMLRHILRNSYDFPADVNYVLHRFRQRYGLVTLEKLFLNIISFVFLIITGYFYVPFVHQFLREKQICPFAATLAYSRVLPPFPTRLGLVSIEELQDLFGKFLRVFHVQHVAAVFHCHLLDVLNLIDKRLYSLLVCPIVLAVDHQRRDLDILAAAHNRPS